MLYFFPTMATILHFSSTLSHTVPCKKYFLHWWPSCTFDRHRKLFLVSGHLRNHAFKWHYLVAMLNFGSAAKSQILMMPQKTHSCIYFFVRPSCCCEKKTLTFDDDWQNDDNSSHVFFEPGQYTENKTNLIYEKVCWNR